MCHTPGRTLAGGSAVRRSMSFMHAFNLGLRRHKSRATRRSDFFDPGVETTLRNERGTRSPHIQEPHNYNNNCRTKQSHVPHEANAILHNPPQGNSNNNMVSTRRNQSPVYQVGDKVEVSLNNGGGVQVGTLVSVQSNTTTTAVAGTQQSSPNSSPSGSIGSSSNRWVVSLPNKSSSTTATAAAGSTSFLQQTVPESQLKKVGSGNASSSSDLEATATSSSYTRRGGAAGSRATPPLRKARPAKKGSAAAKLKTAAANAARKRNNNTTRSRRNATATTSDKHPSLSKGNGNTTKSGGGSGGNRNGVVTAKGILTTRNGLAVCKVLYQTGTLYIYTRSKRAEFIRTK